jgi:uncharacterized RDD family membrane protein YckC
MSDGIVAAVPSEARAYQGRRAGLVTRLVAATVDAGVVVVLLVSLYLGANAVVFLIRPRSFEFLELAFLETTSAWLVFLVLYLTVAWAVTGRSYGDRVMGVRVVDRRGRHPSPLLALVRAVFCALFPIGLFWCAVGRARRSVQDVVLGTSVVYDWLPHRPEPEIGPG